MSYNLNLVGEISVVSNENLKVVHFRQQDLKVNDNFFGGWINVVLFGDIIHLTKVAAALFCHHVSEQEVLSVLSSAVHNSNYSF